MRASILFVAMVCLAAGSTSADDRPQAPSNRAQRLNAIFEKIADSDSPGFAVLLREHGRTVFQMSRGLGNLATRKPISAHTDFRLASCTKQFTAMAVMLLVHDGKLHYNDRLTSVFPEFPAYGRGITIRNLLNHTSGLPDYEDLMDAVPHGQTWTATHQIQDPEVLRLLEAQSHGKFAPGNRWSYSNSGYVVLGAVVKKVSGMSFPEFLHARIFAPLKMTHSVAYVNGKNQVPQRAYGHSKDGDHFTQTDQSSTSATLGDGGVYSNLEDLAKWDDALAYHTLLSAAEMRPALTAFTQHDGFKPIWTGDSGDTDPQKGKRVSYGFGWFLDPYRDVAGKTHPRMWHYGDTLGFQSAIERFTDDGLTIIILCNRSDLDPATLATKVADAYFGFKK